MWITRSFSGLSFVSWNDGMADCDNKPQTLRSEYITWEADVKTSKAACAI